MARSSLVLVALSLVACGGAEPVMPSEPGTFRAELSDVRGANTRSNPLESKALVGVMMRGGVGGFAAFDSELLKDSRSISVEFPEVPEVGQVYALGAKALPRRNGQGAIATVQYWDNTLYQDTAADRYWSSSQGVLRVDAVELKERSMAVDVTLLDAFMERGADAQTAGHTRGTFWLMGAGHHIEMSFLQ